MKIIGEVYVTFNYTGIPYQDYLKLTVKLNNKKILGIFKKKLTKTLIHRASPYSNLKVLPVDAFLREVQYKMMNVDYITLEAKQLIKEYLNELHSEDRIDDLIKEIQLTIKSYNKSKLVVEVEDNI